MTQQEFQNRVQMTVSTEEFWAINEVYNNSELDKDAFCKAWMKMNSNRVKKAAAEAKENKKKELLRDRVWRLFEKSHSDDPRAMFEMADLYLTESQMTFLRSIGINPDDTLLHVRYEMRRYLKVV